MSKQDLVHRATEPASAPIGHPAVGDASPRRITEIVYSPDDGGYWISQTELYSEIDACLYRASVKIFRSKFEAKRALEANKVKWEKWS